MDVETQARAALQMFITPRRPSPREWETALLHQGTPLAFANGLVASTFGAGPRVLFVHGWEGRGVSFGKFIAPLVASGFQAVALDGPAHGDSPGDTTHPIDFAHGIVGVGRELGPLAGVIAHSMGAAATALAIQQGLEAQKVVLIAGPSSVTGVLHRFAQKAQLTEPVAERFYQLVEEHVGVPAKEVETARVGAEISTPALIIHDRDDAEVPFADGQAIAATWPGARLYATTGRGHRRILLDSGVIALAVSFITADERAAALLGSIA